MKLQAKLVHCIKQKGAALATDWRDQELVQCLGGRQSQMSCWLPAWSACQLSSPLLEPYKSDEPWRPSCFQPDRAAWSLSCCSSQILSHYLLPTTGSCRMVSLQVSLASTLEGRVPNLSLVLQCAVPHLQVVFILQHL